MTFSLQDLSELVTGKVVRGEISASKVRPEDFMPPYSDVIKDIKDGINNPSELVLKHGQCVVVSLEAAKNVNGHADGIQWEKLLEETALAYEAGTRLEKLGRKLKQGEQIQYSELTAIAAKAQEKQSAEFSSLDEIEDTETPFIETGWEAFDKHTCGIPEIGVVTLVGAPGIGKTHLMVRLARSFVRRHKNKNIAVFSLEMTKREVRERFLRSPMPMDELKRVKVWDKPIVVEQVINYAATIPDLGLITVDYADFLVRGEITESAMANIYRTLSLGSKDLNCPILLLAQPNRGYQGGLLKPYHIRYTGMAEAMSWMILAIYAPEEDHYDHKGKETGGLVPIDGQAYVIVWKSKSGIKPHPGDSCGAISIPFRGDRGWHPTRSTWFSLTKEIKVTKMRGMNEDDDDEFE